PYALVVALVGMMVGDIPTAYGLSPWVSLAVGTVILVGVVRFFGKQTDIGGEPHLTPAEAREEVRSAV
nr:hypothetical protein [Gemmatimonadota bacterium]